jgi:hypothetical protein
VKVWVATDGVWGQELQTDSGTGTVTVELPQLTRVSAGVTPPDPVDTIRFALHPNPPFLNCLSQYRGDDRRTPQVTVTVVRGDQTDALFVRGQNIRPNLGFTLFTVERSELDAVGNIDAGFHGFGLASYEADFDSSDKGTIRTAIRTILLDQVFEFDDDAKLAPKSPFQVGFWFNDPMDAVACGFDANKPTPFNEDHDAGPNAMISLPNAASGLGPLCTNADLSVTPAVCIPAPD